MTTIDAVLTVASSIVGVLGVVCAIATFKIARRKDNFADGENNAGIKGDIKYIRNGFDDLRLDVKEMNRKQDQTNERVIRVEESCKQAHKRIDSIEERTYQ